MNDTFLGKPNAKIESWIKRKAPKLKVVGEAIEGASLANTSFEINGVSHGHEDYGKSFEFQTGSVMNVAVIGDSSSYVFKVNGVELPSLVDRYDLAPFTLNEDTEINVVYKPNWV